MMEAAKNPSRILSEVTNDNKANVPEGIGVAEDSGFASIAGSISDVSVKNDGDKTPALSNVKFRSLETTETNADRGTKRKVREQAEAEEKKKAAEQYNNEKREQTYKRLMHLLTKSQFYSKYIVEKINSADTTATKKDVKNKSSAKDTENNENEIVRHSQRTRKENKKLNLNQYVYTDMKKKLNDRNKKINLSQEEIETELDNQSGTEETNNSASGGSESFVKPKYFEGALRDYQIDGLQWLKVLYENGVNGILADEMGLGKTIQVIALYSHLLEKRQNGPYLIIAPMSTIPNWMLEFEKFAPNLPIVLFHGAPKVRAVAAKKMKRKHEIADGYSTYPIMITSYEVPIVEKAFMASFKWRYIVVDEGHRIKNPECQLLKVLNRCESMNRLLLTGTPLQNNLTELWSLLNFLLPEIFDDLAVFESWFDAKELQQSEGTEKFLKQEEEKQVLTTLREILKPFMLRRIKDDVCLDIPPKKELIVYAPLTELQHDLYKAVIERDLATLSKIDENKSPTMETEGPTRPKRRCRLRKNCDEIYAERSRQIQMENSQGSMSLDDENNSNWDVNANLSNISINRAQQEEFISEWRQYTDINDRNRDFFIRLQFANRMPLYRQIVNHPFLLHCPLDNSGLPEISENMVKASGKLLVLDAMLKKLKADGHKVLLFSTSVMLLDLIGDYLLMRPWRFLMLNGKHDIGLRQSNIKSFNEDPEIFLFLISTRAGGVGLNLASADTVIIYDSDWNPQADLQAMARCHRIGQTRPVVVYRLCTKGTIDEQIIGRAEAKRKLEKMVISKDNGLDLKDPNKLKILKQLLESTESVVVRAEKEVYTDAELNKILDRSDLVEIKREETAGTEHSQHSN